jgi:hypothetical protein
VLTDTHVSDAGGGAVSLAADFSDDFTGPTLDLSRWSAGTWDITGPYTPTLSNSVITIQDPNGGWVRSTSAYTHGTIEAVAEFGAGPQEHIGFGSDGFVANRLFLFSTAGSATNLFARVNNNTSEQKVDLGAIPVGFHRYRIDWTAADINTDQVTFMIDGSNVAQMIVTNVGATDFFAYLSNDGAGTLQVDSAQVEPPYVASGTYVSCPLDAGSGQEWQTINWDSTLFPDNTLTVQTRTSVDGSNWGPWATVATSGDPVAVPARYLQFQLLLATSDPQTSPLVNSVSLSAGPETGGMTSPSTAWRALGLAPREIRAYVQ